MKSVAVSICFTLPLSNPTHALFHLILLCECSSVSQAAVSPPNASYQFVSPLSSQMIPPCLSGWFFCIILLYLLVYSSHTLFFYTWLLDISSQILDPVPWSASLLTEEVGFVRSIVPTKSGPRQFLSDIQPFFPVLWTPCLAWGSNATDLLAPLQLSALSGTWHPRSHWLCCAASRSAARCIPIGTSSSYLPQTGGSCLAFLSSNVHLQTYRYCLEKKKPKEAFDRTRRVACCSQWCNPVVLSKLSMSQSYVLAAKKTNRILGCMVQEQSQGIQGSDCPPASWHLLDYMKILHPFLCLLVRESCW